MRRLVLCALCICTLFLLCVPAYAHPGDTDDNGGHIDQSAGEYHYHHGYPAHRHYDIDGNGTIDCPYDYYDRTGMNSGSSNSSGGSGSSIRLTYSDGYADGYDDGREDGYSDGYTEGKQEGMDSGYDRGYEEGSASAAKNPKINNWVFYLIAILILVALGLIGHIRNIKYSITEIEEQHKIALDKQEKTLIKRSETESAIWQEKLRIKESENKSILQECEIARQACGDIKRESERLKDKIHALQSEISRLRIVSNQSRLRARCAENGYPVKDLPEDVYFINDYIPVKGTIDITDPFGDYTVYVSKHGRCFHSYKYCGNAVNSPRHLFDYVSTRTPCQLCAKGKYEKDVPEWYPRVKNAALASQSARSILVKERNQHVFYLGESEYLL